MAVSSPNTPVTAWFTIAALNPTDGTIPDPFAIPTKSTPLTPPSLIPGELSKHLSILTPTKTTTKEAFAPAGLEEAITLRSIPSTRPYFRRSKSTSIPRTTATEINKLNHLESPYPHDENPAALPHPDHHHLDQHSPPPQIPGSKSIIQSPDLLPPRGYIDFPPPSAGAVSFFDSLLPSARSYIESSVPPAILRDPKVKVAGMERVGPGDGEDLIMEHPRLKLSKPNPTATRESRLSLSRKSRVKKTIRKGKQRVGLGAILTVMLEVKGEEVEAVEVVTAAEEEVRSQPLPSFFSGSRKIHHTAHPSRIFRSSSVTTPRESPDPILSAYPRPNNAAPSLVSSPRNPSKPFLSIGRLETLTRPLTPPTKITITPPVVSSPNTPSRLPLSPKPNPFPPPVPPLTPQNSTVPPEPSPTHHQSKSMSMLMVFPLITPLAHPSLLLRGLKRSFSSTSTSSSSSSHSSPESASSSASSGPQSYTTTDRLASWCSCGFSHNHYISLTQGEEQRYAPPQPPPRVGHKRTDSEIAKAKRKELDLDSDTFSGSSRTSSRLSSKRSSSSDAGEMAPEVPVRKVPGELNENAEYVNKVKRGKSRKERVERMGKRSLERIRSLQSSLRDEGKAFVRSLPGIGKRRKDKDYSIGTWEYGKEVGVTGRW